MIKWDQCICGVTKLKAEKLCYRCRKAANGNALDPVVIQLHDTCAGTFERKLKFLENGGGKVVEIVLQDERGQLAHIDRYGKVVWSEV